MPPPAEVEEQTVRLWINKHSNLFVYCALCVVVVLSFTLNAINQQADEEALCKSGENSRNVQRQTVEAIYGLATGSIQRDADSPPLTDLELRQYNHYINNVNAFRTTMYRKIKPSDLCAPYVDDDRVRPPTPPFPPIRQ